MPRNIIYSDQFNADDRIQADLIFRKFYESFGEKIPGQIMSIPPDTACRVTWACAWNKPTDLGKEVVVTATDGLMCVCVEIPSQKVIVLRCEDMSVIPGKQVVSYLKSKV